MTILLFFFLKINFLVIQSHDCNIDNHLNEYDEL